VSIPPGRHRTAEIVGVATASGSGDQEEHDPGSDAGQIQERESVSTFEIAELGTQSLVREDAGPVVNVTGIVENTGEMAGNATVELLLDGEVVAERNLSLLVDEEATAVFEGVLAGLEPGEYVLTVRTEDDERSRPLVIEADDDGADGDDGADAGDEEDGSGSDSGDGAPSDAGGGGVALGVGAGSRALVGGTAVVGTVYVLGYYV